MSKVNKVTDIKTLLQDLAPLHFVGVQGSGMRPLAEFASSFGVEVSGSDRSHPSESSNIRFAVEDSAEDQRLLGRAKSVIYSSAISQDHPSFVAAKGSRKHLLHRSDLLAKIASSYKTITVAGTHGKSTTSALIAHALSTLGADPSWIIGAPFANGTPSYHRGRSEWLVIEADESDGSFLKYSPFVAVLNNIEPDHMDYYVTYERLEEAFKTYVTKVMSGGCLVYWNDSKAVKEVSSVYRGNALSFGFNPEADMVITNVSPDALSSMIHFSYHGESLSFSLPLTGKHNALNALAAVSVCVAAGFTPKAILESLRTFPGVKRRLEQYPSKSHLLVFDDYAHNPGKVRSCLSGLCSAFPDRRVIAVFQPHRFSRISSLYESFIACFKGLHVVVIVLPVYSAGEAVIPGFTESEVAKAISLCSQVQTFSAPTLKHATELVKSIIDPARDVIVTIGAGDVWNVAHDLTHP